MDPTEARVVRSRQGDFRLRLPTGERDILRALPAQLRDLMATDDPALERLFPPAYPDDAERNNEYDELVRPDLTASHLTSIDVMEATIDADRLDEDQLAAWMGAINDLRLVLGSRLEVTEELYEQGMADDDPRMPAFALYTYLGWLEEQVVDALAADLGDGTPEGQSTRL